MTSARSPQWGLRLAAALYRFRESLFLLPALVVLGGIVLAEVTAAVDHAVGSRRLPFTWGMNGNSATWLLSTVAGAMITTAGVVFSLTVVSLQLASSQFSPRVMRSFVRDRLSQSVIGLLVATFVFSVLTLRHIGDPADPAPRVAVTVAVVLTVTTVLLIVAHLDHLARGLQVGEVVRRIGAEGAEVVASVMAAAHLERHAVASDDDDDGPRHVVLAPRDGWVTQAPSGRMLAAVPPHTTVRLETRVGAYIHEGEPLATVWPPPRDPDRALAMLARTVAVADTRTMQEDADFAIRQLVDIGLRALSPAINDPTTAVEVTLRLGSLLRRLLVEQPPPTAVQGKQGRLLLRPWALNRDEYVAHAFDQLRQAGASSPQVTAALIRVLKMLILHVSDGRRAELVEPLQRQIDLLLAAATAEPGLLSEDRRRIQAMAGNGTDPAYHGRPDRKRFHD